MIIDGPTTTRQDGSTVCIGYGFDSSGSVTGKFALPKGHDWDAPDDTVSLEYVASMDDLPAVDSQYLHQ